MSAPRVFLLHGLGADRRAFQRFERLLPGDDWSITSLDLLGHGDAPRPQFGYALDDHAEHITEEIVEAGAGSREPAILVGHSYGAATAVALAASRPELVRGIVLLDPVVDLDLERIGSKTAQMIEAKREKHLEATVRTIYPDASDALRAWTVATWERMDMGVIEELDSDWTRFADQVTCPVTIIHGDVDQGGSGDISADYFNEPTVVRIAGAGHYLHATHARETATAVIDAVSALVS